MCIRDRAVGTLGRTIVEGAEEVKLFGETIAVKANIEVLDGVSGHADDRGLMKWISSFNPCLLYTSTHQ